MGSDEGTVNEALVHCSQSQILSHISQYRWQGDGLAIDRSSVNSAMIRVRLHLEEL